MYSAGQGGYRYSGAGFQAPTIQYASSNPGPVPGPAPAPGHGGTHFHGHGTASLYPDYPKQKSLICGVLQIIIGLSSVIVWALAIHYASGIWDEYSYFTKAGTGIWCGLWFILTGAFGIAASRSPRQGFIMIFMVLSIVGLILDIFYIGWSASAYFYSQDLDSLCHIAVLVPNCGDGKTLNILMVVALAIACFYLLVAIFCIIMCGRIVCCGNRKLHDHGHGHSHGGQRQSHYNRQSALGNHPTGYNMNQGQQAYIPQQGIQYPAQQFTRY